MGCGSSLVAVDGLHAIATKNEENRRDAKSSQYEFKYSTQTPSAPQSQQQQAQQDNSWTNDIRVRKRRWPRKPKWVRQRWPPRKRMPLRANSEGASTKQTPPLTPTFYDEDVNNPFGGRPYYHDDDERHLFSRGNYETIDTTALLQAFEELEFVSEALVVDDTDKRMMLEEVQDNGFALAKAPEDLQADRDIVLAAVQQDGWSLLFASNDLKNDQQIVLRAVQQDCRALKFASQELLQDEDFILQIVSQDGRSLRFASEDLKHNKMVVLAAATNNGTALQFASDDLRSNREIVLAAIETKSSCADDPAHEQMDEDELHQHHTNGRSLRYASDELRDDYELVMIAVQQCGTSLAYASHRLKANQSIVKAAIQQDIRAIRYVSSIIKSDVDFLRSIIPNLTWALEFAPDELQNDLDFVLAAVTQDGQALKFAPSRLKNDRRIVSAAVSSNEDALRFASEQLRDDREIVRIAVTQDGWCLRHASTTLRQDEAIVLAAVTQYGRALGVASRTLQGNKRIVLAAVTQDGWSLQYASDALKAEKEVVLAAVSNYPQAIKFALGGLNQDQDCWKAAKLYQEDDSKRNNAIRVALSTKFDLAEQSQSSATNFTLLLNQHSYFREGNFIVYSPNAFSKGTCDPNWTDLEWPCRGTYRTCRMVNPCWKSGVPTNESCWRYSYRYHLQQAKKTNGFMIQVVDYNEELKKHILGKGQQIETYMAGEVGTTIFRVCQPVNVWGHGTDFLECHMVELVSEVQDWYDGTVRRDTEAEVATRTANEQGVAGIEIQFWNCLGDWTTVVRSMKVGEVEVEDQLQRHHYITTTTILDHENTSPGRITEIANTNDMSLQSTV